MVAYAALPRLTLARRNRREDTFSVAEQTPEITHRYAPVEPIPNAVTREMP